MARYQRGEEVTFTIGFFEDAAQAIPRDPLDADQPTYEIVDPDNTVIDSGIAVPNAAPGFYDIVYTIPDDAKLVPEDTDGWRIDAQFIDAGGFSRSYSEAFEVIEKEQEREAVEKRHGYIALFGKDVKLINIRRGKPNSITVDIRVPGQDNTVIETVRQAALLDPEEIIDGSTYAYKDTILAAALLKDTTYVVTWEIEETAASFPIQETELLHVLDSTWVPYLHALDIVMNKVRARATDLQSWTQFELFNALKEGLRIVNGWHPNQVEYSMLNFPHSQLGHFVVLAAQFWLLNSLYMAEGLLAFSFGGQTVTLDYDHTGWVEASSARAMEFINMNLSRDKMAVLRRATPTGVVAVRPSRYGNFRDHRVFKLSSTSSSTVLDLLIGFGLI